MKLIQNLSDSISLVDTDQDNLRQNISLNRALGKSRRRFLRSFAVGAAGLAISNVVPGLHARVWAAKDKADLRWLELADNFAIVQGSGGNVLVNKGSDGVLMVDGGKVEHADQLLDLVAEYSDGQTPSLLFNSHWHWDQIGCNAKLRKKGVDIIAHENTRLWLTTDVLNTWEGKTYPRQSSKALPTKTFYSGDQKLHFNGQEIQYGLLSQAHTDGDIFIKFVDSNIVFAGDVVSGKGYPILDYSSNGWIGGMVQSLEQLLEKMDDQTKVIASTGEVLSKADVQAQFEMCDSLIRAIVKNYYAGLTYGDFLASKPSAKFDSVWGNPDLFLQTAYESVWGHVAQVRGFLRAR